MATKKKVVQESDAVNRLFIALRDVKGAFPWAEVQLEKARAYMMRIITRAERHLEKEAESVARGERRAERKAVKVAKLKARIETARTSLAQLEA